ncbi:MAG: extracellular solute-binding protein [Treponema sp.]|jgi:multiple sugar transport system substrate-binding protein|nr:extracellular solute-binding protein [Treponema sp.]
MDMSQAVPKFSFKFLRIPSPVDKLLWLLVVLLIAGLFMIRFLGRSLPGMDVTLVFAQWWEDQMEGPVLADLAREFTAKNPGIQVTLVKKNWPEILEFLKNPESGEVPPPDLLSLNPYWLGALERESRLAPLGSAGDSPQTYAAPVISFINLLFYNIDLLKEAGFDRPPKNQTEFLSYVQRISQTGRGAYGAGFALGGQDPQSVSRHLLSWIWAAAGSPETAEDFSFNSPRVITVLTFLNQVKENLYPGPFTTTEEALLSAFGEGKMGMIIGSSSSIRVLKNALGEKFGVTTIPSAESYAKKPVFPLSGWYAGIHSGSPHPEEARKFIAFLKEKAGTLAAAAYAVPGGGRRSPEQSRNDPYYAKAFDMYEAGEMVREFYGNMILNSDIRREMELMFAGSKTPEQCAGAIQQSWEETRADE